ncbi:hypothetical protein BHM03_00034765 [Ensete ventricosum]|nr:hypothetical protein BHM03_00034765 [Ensete ventricosum]
MQFNAFCQDYRIQLKFSLVAHPQANGLAEVINETILEGLRIIVAGALTTWVEKLPSVLWALCTTPKTLTEESPYSLAYGTEAVLPLEILFPTLRIEHFTPEVLEADLRGNLDLLEEHRAEAHLKTLRYQRAVADSIIRKGKLALRWEGPSRIIRVIRDETYTLATMEGKTLPRTWHMSNLKKFYI